MTSGSNKSKRVCIIGAGIAGISSARYLIEEGINFTVYEATRYVGGIWKYDPRTGTDENGLHLHTSMYKHLRTNLPKPTMVLGGFPLDDTLPSYFSGEDYYQYLQNYAKHFDVIKYIKFLHRVTNVRRMDDIWKVKYEHVITKEKFEADYDYVIVGNGHFSKPKMPNITGEHLFKGSIIHSHDYRVPDPYEYRRVLVVGAGPSGLDIAMMVAETSSRLIHSRHCKTVLQTPFPPNYVSKPDIKEFKETGVLFVDGTFEEVDDVIYCTGYEFDHAFLDESCGLTIEPEILYPLYQNMVNIRQPTMIIVGLVAMSCLVIALDAQARYAVALINGNFKLPSEEDMMQEWYKQKAAVLAKNQRLSFIHYLAEKEDEYYASLSAESGIERVPPVMYKIRARDITARMENLYTYRDYEYNVTDNDTFTRTKEDKTQRQ